MYTLANDALRVTVLDPLADQDRFGTRYCTGGYIFQIDDLARGPLLSGPNYPDYPRGWIPFDGQGIPDAFNLGPLAEPRHGGPLALIVGIGLCNLAEDTVVDFCRWDVEQAGAALRFRTGQAYQTFALQLERTLTLSGRTLRSFTRLANIGQNFIPVRWFPHPFYPQLPPGDLCRFNVPVSMPANPGFELSPTGFVARQDWPAGQGFYQALDVDAHAPLMVLQKHPVLGLVAGTCSYVPDFMPIWGNPNTFSWEPFLERTVAMGQALEWWIDYDF